MVIPHPVLPYVKPRLSQGERLSEAHQITLGIVGMPREGKPIQKLAQYLSHLKQNHFPEYRLVMGSPNWAGGLQEEYKEYGFELVDTSAKEDYLSTLQNIDILICDFDQEYYSHKGSGVMSDAFSCGCYVICPNFAAFREQVLHPVQVGSLFEQPITPEKLVDAIQECVLLLKEQGQDPLWEYRRARSAPAMAELFDEAMKSYLPIQN